MASMVSDGLAGFADASKEQEVQHTNTPHYHFFHSMLIPSTVKLQKELRGRRFKVSSTVPLAKQKKPDIPIVEIYDWRLAYFLSSIDIIKKLTGSSNQVTTGIEWNAKV